MTSLYLLMTGCTGPAKHTGVPVPLPPVVLDAAVGAGPTDAAVCVLQEAGEVFCWGEEGLSFDLPEEALVSVDGGNYGFCGVTSEGELRCWGGTPDGQPAPEGPVADYSVGFYAICTLDTRGYATCGGSEYWEFGVREDIPSDRAFSRVAAAVRGACALTMEGKIECYVRDDSDLLPPPAGTFAHLSLGDRRGCALAADGRAECWPASFPHSDESFTIISAGFGYECGVTLSSELLCWPQWEPDAVPEEGSYWHTAYLVTRSTPDEGEFLTVDAGISDAVAVTTDGGVAVFGSWEFGTYADAWFAAHPE